MSRAEVTSECCHWTGAAMLPCSFYINHIVEINPSFVPSLLVSAGDFKSKDKVRNHDDYEH